MIVFLLQGVTYPAAHGIWRWWAPPLERSTLATISFTGHWRCTREERQDSLCLAAFQARMRVPFLAFPSRAFSQNISTGKWPSISTVRKWSCRRSFDLLCVTRQGVIGIIWSIYWWHFSYERPATHPKISEEERIYIEESIGESCSISNKVRMFLDEDHCFSCRDSSEAKQRERSNSKERDSR